MSELALKMKNKKIKKTLKLSGNNSIKSVYEKLTISATVPNKKVMNDINKSNNEQV